MLGEWTYFPEGAPSEFQIKNLTQNQAINTCQKFDKTPIACVAAVLAGSAVQVEAKNVSVLLVDGAGFAHTVDELPHLALAHTVEELPHLAFTGDGSHCFGKHLEGYFADMSLIDGLF